MKLVRDKIPQIISAAGKIPEFEIAIPDQMMTLLTNKLKEEVDEFIETPTLEEFADILEVLDAISQQLSFSRSEILKTKSEKQTIRGGFEKGIILTGVRSPDSSV